MISKKWEFISCSSEAIQSLSQQCSISPFLARLLLNRGISEPHDAETFLHGSLKNLPDPFLLKDMDKAVSRLVSAIRNHEKIVVYGDYDVDGTTATSMLLLFFEELGCPVEFYIPHRMREGYSLNGAALEELKKRKTSVVVTVDNGISALKEAGLAKELGLDLIITDHHLVAEKMPDAYAVVNPQRPDCPYPAKEISGAGVAFNLIMALRQRLREEGYFGQKSEPNLKKYLDLVALATVADVVSLKGVNRIFVKYGLQQMKQTSWPGLKALMEIAQVGADVSARHLGFRLGPRLNACGRLYDAATGVRLLTTHEVLEARRLAQELDAANQERRNVEDGILKEATALLDGCDSKRMGHVLYGERWHPGVVGIVASRLAEKYCRPAVLLGKDGERLKGSARTWGNMHLMEVLKECEHLLLKCGGHRAAAGLSLKADKLEEFRKLFEEKTAQRLSPEECFPRLRLDAELDLDSISSRLLSEISLLEPFGQENPAPYFCVLNVEPKFPRIVGGKHLKFEARSSNISCTAIAFGFADFYSRLNQNIDLAFSLTQNTFNGISSLVLEVRDMRNH